MIKERTPEVEYIEAFPIEQLSGAEYNPRLLRDEKRQKLKESITKLGFLFPVIAHQRKFDNNRYVLLAGHQRMRILKELGRDTVPTILIKFPLTLTREKNINQWHNEVENHFIKPNYALEVNCPLKENEIQMVDIKHIVFKYNLNQTYGGRNLRPLLERIQSLINLMMVFGNFNTCILGIDKNDKYKILFGFEYLVACERLGIPARISLVPKDKTEIAEEYLGDKYGVNDFSSIYSTNTYKQSDAQPQRLKNDSKAYKNFFKFFENDDLQGKRFLDIFCGKGVQAEEVKKGKFAKIFSAIDNFELFAVGKRFNLSMQITRYEIQRTYNSMLRAGGGNFTKDSLYDYVICDSVINSVDSLQAESDVIRCIFAFTKAGGLFAINGRTIEEATRKIGEIKHLDKDGFECKEACGSYFFQRYHRSKPHFIECVNNAIPSDSYELVSYHIDGYFYAIFRKKYDILTNEMCESIKREFDLCHKDVSIGYGDKMVSLFKSIYKD